MILYIISIHQIWKGKKTWQHAEYWNVENEQINKKCDESPEVKISTWSCSLLWVHLNSSSTLRDIPETLVQMWLLWWKNRENPFQGEFIYKSQGLYCILEISERVQEVTSFLPVCDLLLQQGQWMPFFKQAGLSIFWAIYLNCIPLKRKEHFAIPDLLEDSY